MALGLNERRDGEPEQQRRRGLHGELDEGARDALSAVRFRVPVSRMWMPAERHEADSGDDRQGVECADRAVAMGELADVVRDDVQQEPRYERREPRTETEVALGDDPREADAAHAGHAEQRAVREGDEAPPDGHERVYEECDDGDRMRADRQRDFGVVGRISRAHERAQRDTVADLVEE